MGVALRQTLFLLDRCEVSSTPHCNYIFERRASNQRTITRTGKHHQAFTSCARTLTARMPSISLLASASCPFVMEYMRNRQWPFDRVPFHCQSGTSLAIRNLAWLVRPRKKYMRKPVSGCIDAFAKCAHCLLIQNLHVQCSTAKWTWTTKDHGPRSSSLIHTHTLTNALHAARRSAPFNYRDVSERDSGWWSSGKDLCCLQSCWSLAWARATDLARDTRLVLCGTHLAVFSCFTIQMQCNASWLVVQCLGSPPARSHLRVFFCLPAACALHNAIHSHVEWCACPKSRWMHRVLFFSPLLRCYYLYAAGVRSRSVIVWLWPSSNAPIPMGWHENGMLSRQAVSAPRARRPNKDYAMPAFGLRNSEYQYMLLERCSLIPRSLFRARTRCRYLAATLLH